MFYFHVKYDCFCVCFHNMFVYLRFWGFFPFIWNSQHLHKNSKSSCKFTFSMSWLVYSIILILADFWYRSNYFIVNELPDFKRTFLNHFNKWACLFVNPTLLVIQVVLRNQMILISTTIQKMYFYLCKDNQKRIWVCGQLTWTLHIIMLASSTLFAMFFNFLTGMNDNYCAGNFIQAIIYGKCYMCTMSAIVSMGLPILSKNNCLQTVLKKLTRYEVGHPIPEVEVDSDIVYMRKIYNFLPLVNCSSYECHSQSVPIAIISLREDQILEHIRLDYKISNNTFKQYMAYISTYAVILILVDTFITIGDGAFCIITIISNPSNDFYFELWVGLCDRAWMIIIKLWVMGYMSYCGSLITIQVRSSL